MEGKTQKLKVGLFIILLINLSGFYFFEPSFYYSLALSSIIIWVWYATFLRRFYEPLVIISLFLTFYNFYNLYLGISLPLWLIGLGIAAISCGFFISTVILGITPSSHFSSLYGLLIGLSSAQTFLALSYWSNNNSMQSNASLSIIVLVVYYVLWRLIAIFIQGNLTNKKVFGYIAFSSLTIIFILLTTSWYNMG